MTRLVLVLCCLCSASVAWAGNYSLTLTGDSSAACTISFSTEAESVDGTHPLEAGDITNFACTITEVSLTLDENDLQYTAGLEYQVSNGKVVALDLQTATNPELSIGNASVSKLDNRWYVFGDASLGGTVSDRVVLAESEENNAPVAVDDAVSVSQGIETTIYVLSNDTDADVGDTLTVTQVTQPTDGSSAVGGGGAYVTYTSADPFSGNPDTFTYTVSDGTDTDVGTVTVTRVSLLTLAQQAADMSAGEWRQLDTVNTFDDVRVTNAEADAVVSTYGGYDIWGTSGSERVLEAWSGGVYDPDGNRMFFLGGGHGSYGGNEVYEFDFDTLTWARLTDPAPLTLETGIYHLPQDVSPADGSPDTPGSYHTYDSLVWNTTTGKLEVFVHYSVYPNPTAAMNNLGACYEFDPDTQTWDQPDTCNDFRQVRAEYDPVGNQSVILDGYSSNYHELSFLSDAGTHTDCGYFPGQNSMQAMLYRDPNTGNMYDIGSYTVGKLTLNGCSSSFVSDAETATPAQIGFYFNYSQVGVASGEDGYLYLWAGDEHISRYNTTNKTWEPIWNEAYHDTGPFYYNSLSSAFQKIFGKWIYNAANDVFIGIANDHAGYSRDGLWLWKRGGNPAENDNAKLGTLTFDGSTQSTLSVVLPLLSGDRDYDSTVTLEYRTAGGGAYTRAADLKRVRPEFVHNDHGGPIPSQGWAGMAWGLDPDTAYDLRVTVTDPDGLATGSAAAEQVLSSVSTKPIPTTNYAGFGTTSVTGGYTPGQLTSEINAQCDGGGGHVFTIGAGVTISGGSVTIAPDTAGDCGSDADHPVVLRGADQATSVIDCTGVSASACVFIAGNNVTVENLTIIPDDALMNNGVQVLGVGNSELNHITIRDVVIPQLTTTGIWAGYVDNTDLYIADNDITGPKAKGQSVTAGGIKCIEYRGQDIEIEHNTVAGCIDGIAGEGIGENKSIAMHHNLLLWGADDGIEFDQALRNVVAHDNLISNTADCLSFQPVYGGPAFAFHNVCYNILRGPLKIKAELNDPSGVNVWNNTFIKAGCAWEDAAGGVYFANGDIRNNLFAQQNNAGCPVANATLNYIINTQPEINVYDYNAYFEDGTFQYGGYYDDGKYRANFALWSAAPGYGTNDVLLAGETIFDTITMDFDTNGWTTWRDPLGKHFILDSGSSANDAGVEIPGVTPAGDSSPDIGACEGSSDCDSTGTFYGVR